MRRLVSEEECAHRIIQVLPRIMRFLAHEAGDQAPGKQLTISQFRVLLQLNRRQHAVSELARCHDVSLPTMTVMIDGLVRRGLVERAQHGDDRRTVLLSITEEGRAILESFRLRAVERVKSIIAALDADKRTALVDALDLLEQALAQSVPKA